MKKLVVILLATLNFTGCAGQGKEWELVWEENFNGKDLDATVWSRITRGESDWQNTQSLDPRCLELRNGHLVLRGIVNDNVNDTAKYITGGVWTRDKKPLLPGRIEVRARLHKAKGAWPAIWIMGFNRKKYPWPKGGEIDIMERLNGDSIAYQSVHSAWTQEVKAKRIRQYNVERAAIDPDGWNVYGVDIEPDSLVFRVNGKSTFTYYRVDSLASKGQYPFFCPQYLILDMQLGGRWVGKVNSADLPVEMEIDWVRNWVRKSNRRTERPKE